MTVRIVDGVQRDTRSACNYYSQNFHQGLAFLEAAAAALQHIASEANSCPKCSMPCEGSDADLRVCEVTQFPCQFVFMIEPDTVTVLALVSTDWRSGDWQPLGARRT